MPTIEENRDIWENRHSWPEGGDEWSVVWQGVDMEWFGTLLPRIHAFVPTGTILEIAPGFGRWTQYLKDLCRKLIAVDLARNCIEACRERFKDSPHVSCHVNDGKSLEMVPDGVVDFLFSFDSLVHAEEDALQAYVQESARILAPNGVGFIHHSNLGEYGDLNLYHQTHGSGKNRSACDAASNGASGKTEQETALSEHSRARSMTGEKFVEFCREADLCCISQEIGNWGSPYLIDCVSVFTTKNSVWSRPLRVVRNPDFGRESHYLGMLAPLYGERFLTAAGKSGAKK